MESICKRLKKAMLIRNIKQIELSEKTKIPKSSINQYMSGYAEPKQDRIALISKALNISPAWLIGYDVPMEIEKSKNLKSVEDLDFSGINRIAAHFEGDEFSEDDLNEIQNFINYVKQKNKNKEK